MGPTCLASPQGQAWGALITVVPFTVQLSVKTGPRLKSGQLQRQRPGPQLVHAGKGGLPSGCYHGTAPAEHTKQRRTGQACIRLDYITARCSAAKCIISPTCFGMV